ncbi:MAG: tRNA threonylcarbamoyladenosine biosynthesis protein TsaE [Halioglobus sp.]|jgi:tRNA threonylcarbamoyladenosine biosynthesis protein TsaE
MTNTPMVVSAADEDAMVALGAALAGARELGLIIFLHGDLGMGKTTLSRGFIQSLGHLGAVKSPTYTLVEPYEFEGFQVYHFDLYRLGDAEELEFIGIRDYFGDKSVCLVEWPERGQGALPTADLVITIQREGRGRILSFEAQTKRGESVLTRMQGAIG